VPSPSVLQRSGSATQRGGRASAKIPTGSSDHACRTGADIRTSFSEPSRGAHSTVAFKIRGSASPKTTFLARGSEPPPAPFAVEGPGGKHYTIKQFREVTPLDHNDRNDRVFVFSAGEHPNDLPSIGTLTVLGATEAAE
jgi:hypothetical protein